MLYELHEMQHGSMTALRVLAQSTAQLYGSPYSPLSYTPLGRMVSAGSELLLRTTQRYEKPIFGITETTIDGMAVQVVEQVTLDKPFCQLRRFVRVGNFGHQPKVLIVAPLSGHYATLLRHYRLA